MRINSGNGTDDNSISSEEGGEYPYIISLKEKNEIGELLIKIINTDRMRLDDPAKNGSGIKDEWSRGVQKYAGKELFGYSTVPHYEPLIPTSGVPLRVNSILEGKKLTHKPKKPTKTAGKYQRAKKPKMATGLTQRAEKPEKIKLSLTSKPLVSPQDDIFSGNPVILQEPKPLTVIERPTSIPHVPRD